MNDPMKKSPDLNELEDLLRTIQPVPGVTFHQKLEHAPWMTRTHGENKMKPKLTWALIACLILLIAGLAFTPPGRALADQIIHFFNPAAGTTLPVTPEPTATPEPPRDLALLPAEQVVAPTAVPPDPADLNLSEAQLQNLDSTTAQSLLSYPLAAPLQLPDGFKLDHIAYDATKQVLSMTYSAGKEILVFSQSSTVAPDGSGKSWQADGVNYSLTSSEGVSKSDLDQVAESVKRCGKVDYSCQIRQASAATGFIPWQFEKAPEGLGFKSLYYQPGMIAIWYGGGQGDTGVIQSSTDFTSGETSEWFSVPADAVQKLTVADQPAEYVNGDFTIQPGQDHGTWQPGVDYIRLRWKNGSYWFQIVKWGEPHMKPEELAELAGTLTKATGPMNADAQAGPPTNLNDGLYTTLSDAEAALGGRIPVPGMLPQGEPFHHARVTADKSVMLFYGAYSDDGLQMTSAGMVITLNPVSTQAGDGWYSDYPKDKVKDVQVNGQPAKLIEGVMYSQEGSTDLTWHDGSGILALIFSTDTYRVDIQYNPSGTADRLTPDQLIQIAESMK